MQHPTFNAAVAHCALLWEEEILKENTDDTRYFVRKLETTIVLVSIQLHITISFLIINGIVYSRWLGHSEKVRNHSSIWRLVFFIFMTWFLQTALYGTTALYGI